jgi:hypothetical protein
MAAALPGPHPHPIPARLRGMFTYPEPFDRA